MLNKIKQFINNHFTITAFIIFAVVIFSLYGKSLTFDWVYLDDDVLILDKQDYLSFSNIKNIFSTTVFKNANQDQYCRPLLNISFMIDKYLYGTKPLGYHLTNTLIHLLSVFLLFIFLSKYYDKYKTFIIVLLFAVHPSVTQAIVWIPGRNDSLLALFSIISFIFLDKYIDTKKIFYFLLNLLFLFIVLLIKETAIFLPIFYLFYMYIRKCNKKYYFCYGIFWAFILFVYFLYRHFVLTKQTLSLEYLDLLRTLISTIPVITKYIANILFPFNLSVFLNHVQTYYLLSISSILIFSLLFVLLKTKFNFKILFGILWFVLFLIPTFIIPLNQYYDHRIYLPLIGIIIILEEIMKCLDLKKVSLIFLVIFCLFVSLSFSHSTKFQNKEIFWVSAYVDSPNSAVANSIVADLLTDVGSYDKAIEKYLRAIELEQHSRYYVNLAVCYIKMGNLKEAEKYLLSALNLRQDNPMIYYNLANIYKYENRIEEAKQMKELYLKVFKYTNSDDTPLEINL